LVAQLEKRIRALEERLGQNSRNSGRPPSTDPPGMTGKAKPPTGRRPGGQEGHEGKKRPLLAVEQVDNLIHHYPEKCENCGLALKQEPTPERPPPLRHQTWELTDKPVEVTEDQYHSSLCTCGHTTRAPMPEHLSAFGPGLTALGAFFSGACHLSRRLVEEVFEDVLKVPIALGTLSNLEAHVSEALWAAATATVAFFSIHRLRGEEGLLKLLGGKLFGIFTTDRWSTYGKLLVKWVRQICWAHLMRDFQKLIDRGGREGKLGERLKETASWIFDAWKDFKTGDIDEPAHALCGAHPFC
jgi:transposase